MDWQSPHTLPEKGENERFAVYLAFCDGTVQLADWLSYTTAITYLTNPA